MDAEEKAKLEARLAEIDTILASGASSVTVDGTTTSYSLRDLRSERTELTKRLATGGSAKRRPFILKPRLG